MLIFKRNYLKFYFRATLFISLAFNPCGFAASDSVKDLKISKAYLLKNLYCNASLIEMKKHYDVSPASFPWEAKEKAKIAYDVVFGALDHSEMGMQEAIEKDLITKNEGILFKFKAHEETKSWLTLSKEFCLTKAPDDQEGCLKDLNSEVFYCYSYIKKRALAIESNMK